MRKTLIIIIAFNGARWLPDVLGSLGSGSDYDVWVRDNGSFDETVGILKKHPAVTFFKQGENIGFGRANNDGMRFALANNYDSVFLLNQDCRIDAADFLRIRKQGLSDANRVTCPVQMNWDGDGANFAFDTRYAPQWKSSPLPFETDFVNAAAWFIPIRLVQLVGGFNPVFFMYGEDRDWGRRLLAVGGEFTVIPTVFCFHDSSGQKIKWRKIEMNRKIILSVETTEYFFCSENFIAWRRGWLRRAIKRSFQRKQLFNTAVMINPLAEAIVFKTIVSQRAKWEGVRAASNSLIPFLGATES